VAVFAIVFFLTRGSSPIDQTSGQQLTVDPNSTPVQPAGTPTGQGETDILPMTVATPTPTPASTRPVESATQAPATVTGNFGSNENSNTGRRNRNANQPSVEPSEAPPPPPPKPSPTVRTVQKETPAANEPSATPLPR